MKKKPVFTLVVIALLVSLSCNLLSQNQPVVGNSGILSAEATSEVSVQLKWTAVGAATWYEIEIQYGSGEFIPIARLAADQTSFEHFVVPGSANLTYWVTAATDSGDQSVRPRV